MKKRAAPGDQQSRDAILNETGKNVFVQASAGTGKTTLIVDRVVELVRKGIPLDKLAVVTFTNAAAAELRFRIRNKLRILGDEGSSECASALKMFSSAWISTIHGFASRILKEYFNFTGVDPSFSITETHFTPVEINREWDRWLLELDPELKSTDVLVRTTTELQKTVALGIEKIRWLDSVENVGGTAAATGIFEEYFSRYEPLIDSVLSECTDRSDKLFSGGAAFLKGLRKLKEGLSNCDNADVTAMISLIRINSGKKKCWKDKERAKEILGDAREEFRKISPVILSGKLTEETFYFAGGFAKELRDKWDRDKSRLSYNDLLYVAWKAVAGSSRLAGCLSERFRHVLIDEFQDTSLEQTALFDAFLRQEGSLPEGIITIVADDKQSIYGWRNADIETYNDFRRKLERTGALSETITTNFRSSKRIVRFVNAFGARLFSNQTPEEEPFGCRYSPIEPRPGAPEGCRVRIVTVPEIPEELKSRYNRNAYGTLLQAKWFADYLKTGLNDGNVPEDYALLYRSRTHLHYFIDVLESEGIPYFAGSSRDFLKRTEITDLRELLRCLLYPGDSLAWVHTLRSLFFGTPDNLIDLAIRSGTKGYCETAEDCPEEIADVNHHLRRLRSSITAIPLADFLFELFFQTEMIPVLAAVKYQKNRRLGNLQYILEQVLSGKIQSPFELLHALDGKFAPERTEEPSSVPSEGGAVTVTTIHGAKGLAWKHVVIASMPTDRHGRRGKVISYDHRNLAAFNLGVPMDASSRNTMKSPYWPEINKISEAREKAELRRLLYVAVTRPRDSLVIFARPEVRHVNSDGAILWQSLQSAVETDPGCCQVEEMVPTKQLSVSSSVKFEVKDVEEVPTSGEGVLFEIDPEPEGWQSHGAAIGDCVHEVMEKIDFSSPEEWFTCNREYLKRLYGDDYREIKELSLRFFRMKLPFNLEKSEILGREYPYFVKTSRGLKKRYIDLLLRENGKLTVVDYKTDSFGGSSADDIAAGYLKTQKHYIRDISEIYATEARGYLVFLRERIVFPVLAD